MRGTPQKNRILILAFITYTNDPLLQKENGSFHTDSRPGRRLGNSPTFLSMAIPGFISKGFESAGMGLPLASNEIKSGKIWFELEGPAGILRSGDEGFWGETLTVIGVIRWVAASSFWPVGLR
jgi:hypothetical protein